MADGPKIDPAQLALMDQLNQKLANAEITAKEYAAAIKEAGLELTHTTSLLQQKITRLNSCWTSIERVVPTFSHSKP